MTSSLHEDAPLAPRSGPPIVLHESATSEPAAGAAAFGGLAEHYYRYLLAIAEGELAGDLRAKVGASDLVQETMLEAHQALDQFRGSTEAELRAWLRQILLSRLAHAGRRYRTAACRSIRGEVSLDDHGGEALAAWNLPADATPPVERVLRDADAAKLRRALGRLPETYRQCLVLRSFDDLPFAEVGAALGISSEAARKLWSRAIVALKRELSYEPE